MSNASRDFLVEIGTEELPAGDLVLYSGGTVHRVMPVTRGVRIAAFFWVQSMVRDDTRRAILLCDNDAEMARFLDLDAHGYNDRAQFCRDVLQAFPGVAESPAMFWSE